MTDTRASAPCPGTGTDDRPLAGVRICLLFEWSLSHYTRTLQEIEALQEAGAVVSLLTQNDADEPVPPGVRKTVVPLFADPIPASRLRRRPFRFVDNLARRALRFTLRLWNAQPTARARIRALRERAAETDIFWVVDYLSLPGVVRAAGNGPASILYETVDLVPEYEYFGERHRLQSLRRERRALKKVDGFITACDSYADYYEERYGGSVLTRRPVVRDNMPATTRTETRPTGRPLRLLFLGSLMFDRPLVELIDAMALVTADVTLTFQGKNLVGDAPRERIASLGLEERVSIIDPCPPAEIVDAAAAYDIGVVALRGEDENERRASTSKLFTYMSAGLAVLGSNLPGIARVVNQYGNGRLVDGMEPAAWARAIDEIAALPDTEIDEMKQHSLAASELHSWENQRPAFIAEFCRALQARR